MLQEQRRKKTPEFTRHQTYIASEQSMSKHMEVDITTVD